MACCKNNNGQSTCQCASSSSSFVLVTDCPKVALPKRKRNDDDISNKPPVWSINSSPNQDAPLPSKIIGLSDGLTVPFALTAGLSSIGNSRLVVIGGIAELIAGAISMGVGGFLASQAERDHFRYLRRTTGTAYCAHAAVKWSARSMRIAPSRSRRFGFFHRYARYPWNGNQTTELDEPWHVGPQDCYAAQVVEEESQPLRWQEDVGLTAFLLKFGEGMGSPTARLYISAFTIGAGYLVGGLVPLVPYFFVDSARIGLLYSCIVTGITLLIFGAVKTHYTGATGGTGGYIWGAVSTLLVGGFAAGAAFGIVHALEASE
ncbi:VIT family [Rhizoctonia solani]|uniref:VIT family n=1 Tax=Rhizoctonia solani TaxID=456999 RepID=A0A8H7I961_9AGAM|nr:VIT family [Rhizoctonia solani]